MPKLFERFVLGMDGDVLSAFNPHFWNNDLFGNIERFNAFCAMLSHIVYTKICIYIYMSVCRVLHIYVYVACVLHVKYPHAAAPANNTDCLMDRLSLLVCMHTVAVAAAVAVVAALAAARARFRAHEI